MLFTNIFSSFQTQGIIALAKPLGSYVQPCNLLRSRECEWKCITSKGSLGKPQANSPYYLVTAMIPEHINMQTWSRVSEVDPG